MNNYLKHNTEKYPPHVADKLGWTIDEVISEFINIYPNARFVDNMLIADHPDEYWYYEVCDTPYGRGQYQPASSIQKYWLNNQRSDQHVSAFKHDERWLKNLKSTGSVSCQNTKISADLLWIEIDRKDYKGQANFHESIIHAQKVKQRTRTAYRQAGGNPDHVAWVFTSGNSSSHVAVNTSIFGSPVTDQRYNFVWGNMAHALAADVRFNNGLIDVRSEPFEKVLSAFKLEYGDVVADRHNVLQSMENIDPNIYRTNSLIRQPWSVHPKGGHKKALVDDKGNFVYEAKALDIVKKKPLLASWWLDCFEERQQRTTSNKKYDETFIIETYSKHLKGFNPDNADSRGWCGPYYSCFYENDSNPAVYINIKNGVYFDHGSPDHNYSFDEFILEMRK